MCSCLLLFVKRHFVQAVGIFSLVCKLCVDLFDTLRGEQPALYCTHCTLSGVKILRY